MILVEVLRGMDWPAEMWKELSSALKEIIQEVIKDQEVHIVFPYLCEGIDKKEGFLAIEIFTEGGYDERLAIKQRVECRIKEQFFLGGPPPSVHLFKFQFFNVLKLDIQAFIQKLAVNIDC